MKFHIILGALFVVALIAPLGGAAPIPRPAEAEDLAQAAEPSYAVQPVEAVEEVGGDGSGSDESADPKAQISMDYYIDVKDKTRPPPPWWW